MDRTLPEDSKPVLVPHKITIARKAKPFTTQISHEKPTSAAPLNGTGSKRKRSLEEVEDGHDRNMKRGKNLTNLTNDEVVVVDDSSNGAIVIEDD